MGNGSGVDAHISAASAKGAGAVILLDFWKKHWLPFGQLSAWWPWPRWQRTYFFFLIQRFGLVNYGTSTRQNIIQPPKMIIKWLCVECGGRKSKVIYGHNCIKMYLLEDSFLTSCWLCLWREKYHKWLSKKIHISVLILGPFVIFFCCPALLSSMITCTYKCLNSLLSLGQLVFISMSALKNRW